MAKRIRTLNRRYDNRRCAPGAISDFEAAALARALGDPTRLGILTEIASQKELSVGQLRACRRITKASVSHHLKLLLLTGLVTFRRSGRYLFYRAVPARLVDYSRFLSKIGNRASDSARSSVGEILNKSFETDAASNADPEQLADRKNYGQSTNKILRRIRT